MGLILKEVNLPHQMLVVCSFIGGASLSIENPQILPLPHYMSIDCVIVQVLFSHAFLWQSHSRLSGSPYFTISRYPLPSCSLALDERVVLWVCPSSMFCTNLWSQHYVQLFFFFTRKSRPLMRTESYPHLWI